MLRHAEAKVLITDTEFAPIVGPALALLDNSPLVVDIDDAMAPRGARVGNDRLRALRRRRRSRFRMGPPRRRMERDLAQLHVRHHRQSKGRRLSSPRRVFERAVEHHRLGHAAPRRLSVDAADVPLQRLVLRMDRRRAGRHQRVPAPRRAEGDLRRYPRAQGQPLLRCADRARDAHQCARAIAQGNRPQGERAGRGGGAAGGGDRRHGAHGVRHHACLWADGNLRTGCGVRQARGVGQARHRRAHRAQRTPGRALYLRGRHDGHGSRDHDRSPMGQPDDRRDNVPRQHHDERLSQEPRSDDRGFSRRMVPLRAISPSCSRTATSRSATAPRT